jgi:hypothetical protein
MLSERIRRRRRSFFAPAFLLLLPLWTACIPSSTDSAGVFEIREAAIDSFTTGEGDSLAAGNVIQALAWYTTGSEECYCYFDSTLVRSDTVFEIAIREKVFTRRLCLEMAVSVKREFLLANTLAPGQYRILGNQHTGDTLRYEFKVY